MFLTDMQSSLDDEDSVLKIAKDISNEIHTTVIGIGVDLSVSTVTTLSMTPGCKYISVASASEFEESVIADFSYDVTPIAFNIKINISGARIKKGYGSPEVNELKANCSSIAISSEFPTLTVNRCANGALLLFKLDLDQEQASSISIQTAWTSMQGVAESRNDEVLLAQGSLGIRKAIALVNYVDLQSDYILEDDSQDHATISPSSSNSHKEPQETSLSVLHDKLEKSKKVYFVLNAAKIHTKICFFLFGCSG